MSSIETRPNYNHSEVVKQDAGFNDHSETVEISAQDRIMGPKIYNLFTKKLIRPLPWDIKNGKIEVYKRFDAFVPIESVTGEKYTPDVRERVIITKGLEHETISDGLARSVAQHKFVEDYLRDFMKHGTDTTRNNMGLSMTNLQWGREELQHGLADGLILEATGHKTAQEIIEDYYANLDKTWEPPFDTERRIVIYSAFQEPFTALNYMGMAEQALKEDAPITAEILTLIAEDERYHGGGYRAISKLYYEEDPEGTVADAVYVAKNFRMPVQNLLADQHDALVDLIKYAGFKRERVAIGTIQHTLRGFGFVPEKQIQEIVKGYLKKPNNDKPPLKTNS